MTRCSKQIRQSLFALFALALIPSCDLTDSGEEAPFQEESVGESVPVEAGTVDFGDGPTDIIYEVIDGQAVLHDDMVLGPVDLVRSGQFVLADPNKEVEGPVKAAALRSLMAWPNGRVPYKIDTLMFPPGSPMFTKIMGAISEWNTKTIVKLVPAVGNQYHVNIGFGSGCRSNVGYLGEGANQNIWLSFNCSQGNIVHEIGHTVGFHHEQARVDREDFITIEEDNMQPNTEIYFQTYIERGRDGIDFGSYDINSVMQYASHAFSDNGKPTIVREGCDANALFVPPWCLIASQPHLSQKDQVAATRMVVGSSPDWVKFENDYSGQCLRPEGGSRTPGATVTTDRCTNSYSRYWTIVDNPHGDGELIVNRWSYLCLEKNPNGYGSPYQNTCTGNAAQTFDIEGTTGTRRNMIFKEDTNICLRQVPGQTTPVFTTRCTNTGSRRWLQ